MSEKNIVPLQEILGAKLKEILRVSNDVHRYLWEQVIAICLYSREIYVIDERARDFHNRILLVHCINIRVRKPEDRLSLLNLLESNKSSSAMIEMLRDLKLDHVIQTMEELNIAFPEKSSSYRYSYWQMYHSLSDSINVFKELLKIRVSEDFLVEMAGNYYRRKLKERTILRNPSDIFSRETLSQLYSDNKDFMLSEKENLTRFLYSKTLKYFGQISSNIFKNHKHEINFEASLNSNIDIKSNKESIHIEIKKQFLESLADIGQYDALINELKKELITSIQSRKNSTLSRSSVESEQSTSSEIILKSISKWQKCNSALIVTKVDQCPRRIAGILKFDLENHLGIFTKEFSNNIYSYINHNNKKTRNGMTKSISTIIKLFLYYDYDLSDSYIIGDRWKIIDFSSDDPSISRDNLELDDNKIFRSKIMEDWARPDIKNITELYKKIPRDIFSSMSKKIKGQIDTSRKESTNAFPLCEEVPMPLWAKL